LRRLFLAAHENYFTVYAFFWGHGSSVSLKYRTPVARQSMAHSADIGDSLHTHNGARLPTVTPTAIRGFFGRYRFLSNFHLKGIDLDGLTYPSSEHAYMAQKSCGLKMRTFISTLPTPQAAQIFGHSIQTCCTWPHQRLAAMRRVLAAKFKDEVLAAALLATGDRYLEETNDRGDVFWGVCDGQGQNQLGLLLMSIRESLLKRRAIGCHLERSRLRGHSLVFATI
jgi:ribA/ribD-fused uncharacterized protein